MVDTCPPAVHRLDRCRPLAVSDRPVAERDTPALLKRDLQPLEQAPLINVTVDVLESPGAEAINTAEVTRTTRGSEPQEQQGWSLAGGQRVQLGIAKRPRAPARSLLVRAPSSPSPCRTFGPAKAKNVVVVDQVEAGLKATSATDRMDGDVGSSTTVTCAGELPAVGLAVGHRRQADVDRSVPGGTTPRTSQP